MVRGSIPVARNLGRRAVAIVVAAIFLCGSVTAIPIGDGRIQTTVSQTSDYAGLFDTADVFEAAHATLVPGAFGLPVTLDPTTGGLIAAQRDNLRLADALASMEMGDEPLAHAVEVAHLVTKYRAEALWGALPDVSPFAGSDRPSIAVDAILSHLEVTASADHVPSIDALDRLPEPFNGALTALLDAYLAYSVAHEDAYSAIPAARSQAQIERYEQGGTPEGPLVDLRGFLVARGVFLDAIVVIDQAAKETPLRDWQASNECRVDVPPALSLDLCGVDDLYTEDYFFQFDLAGNDTYLNNAGGSAGLGARALVDLDGDDVYGDIDMAASARRGDGVNGGGSFFSSGLLVDVRGNDIYAGGSSGVNGGAHLEGKGLLIDAAGDDRYDGWSHGVNGGASCCYNMGTLIDVAGDDHYIALGAHGLNGGARGASPDSPGLGFLYDGSGSDVYEAGSNGANGGTFNGGVALLFDRSGDDVYRGTHSGVNGGARGGVGLLYDAAGDDDYDAIGFGANGGGWSGGGIGMLLDARGNDTYSAAHAGINGGGGLNGIGRLLDHDGDDRYEVGGHGANGGSYRSGIGLLWDRRGDDTYLAEESGSNGEGDTGFGLLLDTGGSDHYQDPSGTCQDCSVVPKGLFGAQIDQDWW